MGNRKRKPETEAGSQESEARSQKPGLDTFTVLRCP
jgi:hypothetical protein